MAKIMIQTYKIIVLGLLCCSCGINRPTTATVTSESLDHPKYGEDTLQVALPPIQETPTITPSPTNVPATPTLLPYEVSVSDGSITIYDLKPSLSDIGDALASLFGEAASLSSHAQLFFWDLNSDESEDLIIYDIFYIRAFLWDEFQYIGPFNFYEKQRFNAMPSTRLSFRDVTHDGLPDIVVDSVELSSGGSELFDANWETSFFHCNEEQCNEVLDLPIAHYTIDDGFGGTCMTIADISIADDEPTIRYLSEGFSLYGCGMYPGIQSEFSTLRIDTSEVAHYRWNGSTFELVRTEIARLSSIIRSRGNTASKNNRGEIAHVVIESNCGATKMNDYCQLFISGEEVGGHFGCKDNFTDVDWVDITGDGQEEVVVTAFSGASAYDLEGDIGSLDCAHQRLMAYRIMDGKPRNIADIAGCVINSDLFGVSLSDINSDGSLEIIASQDPLLPYWAQLNGEYNPLCEDASIVTVDQNTIQSCDFFEFNPLKIVLGWDGQYYSPLR